MAGTPIINEAHHHAADESEHLDVDVDIVRMSANAFSILDSITDEVAEISKQASSRSLKLSRHRSISPSSSDDIKRKEDPPSPNAVNQSLEGTVSLPKECPVAVISPLSSPRKYSPTKQSEQALKALERCDHLDDHRDDDHDRDEDDDEDDMSDDESIMKELSALRSVTRAIEMELKDQDADSMRNAIARIEASPKDSSLKNLLGSDDEEIIRRILDEEMKKDAAYKGKGNFLQEYGLYGPGVGGEELNSPLLVGAVFVWTIVFRLTWKIMYEEL